MKRAIAVLCTAALLLSGCTRKSADLRGPAPAVPDLTTSATAANPPVGNPADANGAQSVQSQLTAVDNLLKDIDAQVDADAQTPPDTD
jgi:hypothetical protein